MLLHAQRKGPEERARDEKQLQCQACLEVTELLEKNVLLLWRATPAGSESTSCRPCDAQAGISGEHECEHVEVLDKIVSKQLAQLQSSAWREQDCDPREQTCNRPSSQPGPTHSNRQQRVQSKGLANVHGEVLKKASEAGASELHSWCFCRSTRSWPSQATRAAAHLQETFEDNEGRTSRILYASKPVPRESRQGGQTSDWAEASPMRNVWEKKPLRTP